MNRNCLVKFEAAKIVVGTVELCTILSRGCVYSSNKYVHMYVYVCIICHVVILFSFFFFQVT